MCRPLPRPGEGGGCRARARWVAVRSTTATDILRRRWDNARVTYGEPRLAGEERRRDGAAAHRCIPRLRGFGRLSVAGPTVFALALVIACSNGTASQAQQQSCTLREHTDIDDAAGVEVASTPEEALAAFQGDEAMPPGEPEANNDAERDDRVEWRFVDGDEERGSVTAELLPGGWIVTQTTRCLE